MTISVGERKTETIRVELKRDDVRQAVIKAALAAVQAHHTKLEIDDRFSPQIVSDGYEGFEVYFTRAEPKSKAA